MRNSILFTIFLIFISSNVMAQVYDYEVICGGGSTKGGRLFYSQNKEGNECEMVECKEVSVKCYKTESCDNWCVVTGCDREGGNCDDE